MESERWLIEAHAGPRRQRAWVQHYPNAKGGPTAAWVHELDAATYWTSPAEAEKIAESPAVMLTRTSAYGPRVRLAGEASIEGRQAVAKVIREAITSDRYGYLNESDLDVLTAYEPLRRVLVRCSGCRFTCGAGMVRHIGAAIEAHYDGDEKHGRGLDYVRDVCLPSSDPGWQQYRSDRYASDAGHRPFYQGGRPG